MSSPSFVQLGVGVVVPHDMALDRELWRWVPDDVTLHLTRTPHVEAEVTVDMVAAISETAIVARGVRDLVTTESGVYAYACTSGSFVRGVSGERELVDAMTAAGAPAAVTTSGALLSALSRLDVHRVAIATPYHPSLTALLDCFLVEAGFTLAGSAHLGLTSDIWKVGYETTADLIRRADDPSSEAIVVSCTNLPTYDLIAPLEAELGKPVVTANQATMWASLQAIGRTGPGPGQRLLSA
jgi:maleate isomerase